MKVEGAWIEAAATQAVCTMLEQAGHQAFFVGGCVRNALLGAPVGDIDIATDALPEQVMGLAAKAGLNSVPTGLAHGTVTVIADHLPHEITTFRKDIATDGRHAMVAFADDIAEDARRRDFTMNALYARSDGSVIDPLSGMGDLQARHVRFIDDPGQRIREDYLRILRFFRFHAWYGDAEIGLDPEGLAAVAAHLDGLAGLSNERVGAEMIKLLSAPDPAPSLAAMRSSGVLHRVLPGADDRLLAPLIHLEADIAAPPCALRRLACLGGDNPGARLRLSRAQARQREMMISELAKGRPAGELGYRFGVETGLDILLLRAAISEHPVSQAARGQLETGAASDFPVSARDLTPDYTGQALGQRLKELEQRWIDSEFQLDRESLLRS